MQDFVHQQYDWYVKSWLPDHKSLDKKAELRQRQTREWKLSERLGMIGATPGVAGKWLSYQLSTVSLEQWNKTLVVWCLWGIILPTCIGIIWYTTIYNHLKDPYEATSISWKVRPGFQLVAHLDVLRRKWNAHDADNMIWPVDLEDNLPLRIQVCPEILGLTPWKLT